MIWVSRSGNNSSNGTTRTAPVQTVTEAWSRIPQGIDIGTAYEISIEPGIYDEESLPTYWESRHGTAAGPIEVSAAEGAGSVTFLAQMNVFDVRYLTVRNITIAANGDAFHCERCLHVTLTAMVLDGGRRSAHDLLKVNQSSYINIENSDIHGAEDNALDFVAVEHAVVRNNRIHDAGDWCAYAKGGSADVLVEGNEIYNCGTGGFTAGQGTGLEFMVSPHLTYEAEDVMVRNNSIHDTDGAGLGVNGGHNVTMTGNTLTRVGARSHTIEVGFGARGCDGNRSICSALVQQGAWGTSSLDDGVNYVRIPNRSVLIEGNVIDNSTGSESAWQQLFVPGPWQGSQAGSASNPRPALADDGLVIRGNTFRNGGTAKPLGVGEPNSGCQVSNPTCNPEQLRRDNRFQ